MPISLLALKPHRYDGRLVRKGQEYSAQSESDATLLTSIGYAERAKGAVRTEPDPEPAAPPTPEPTPEPAIVDATPSPVPDAIVDEVHAHESAAVVDALTEDVPKRRRYQRKDLSASE